jgi:hypothetical protein
LAPGAIEKALEIARSSIPIASRVPSAFSSGPARKPADVLYDTLTSLWSSPQFVDEPKKSPRIEERRRGE